MANRKIILGKMTLRNFLSYGDNITEFDLRQPGLNLVFGENRDIGNGSRNGVGKTAFLQAVSVAFFGKSITNIKIPNLVNATNKKNLEISLEFLTDWNMKEYRIEFGLKPDTLRFIDLSTGIDFANAGKADIYKQIQEVIGIDHKTFLYIVLFSSSTESFLSLSVPKQREVIESLFNMAIITEKAAGASELKKTLKKDLDFEKHNIQVIIESNERTAKLITSVEMDINSWDSKAALELSTLTDALESIGSIDHNTLADEIQLVDAILSVDSDISKIETIIRHHVTDLKAARIKYKGTQREINTLSAEITHLEDDNCPFCKQSMPNAKVKLLERSTEYGVLIGRYGIECLHATEFVTNIVSLEIDQEVLSTIKKELVDARVYDNLDEIRILVNEKDNIIKSISDIESSTNPHTSHLLSLQNESILEVDTTIVDTLQTEFNHVEFLYKLLSKKDSFIRKKIIGQTIPYLNQRLKKYVSDLGLPHTVLFSDDLTASISQFGRELSFGNLSTGERRRVDIGLSLAFRDILSNMHTEFSTLFLDEVLDSGMDEPGVWNTIDVLNDLIRESKTSVYLISHRQEVIPLCDNVMTIIKDGGFSRVEYGSNE